MKTDYHQITLSRMCAVGQTLRAQALLQATRIKSAAWVRDGITPADRANMLQDAREASSPAYQDAFYEWQQHYARCETCQEALRWQ